MDSNGPPGGDGPDRVGQALKIFGLSILTGVVTGLVEALVLWGSHAFFGRVVFVSEQVLFMAPAAYAMVFAVLGTALALLALVAPRLMTLKLATFGCVAFGFGCLLLPYSQIHRYAAAILAAGVGSQAAYLAGVRPSRYARALVSVAGGLAGLALLAGFATGSTGSGGAALAPARAGAPNVLVIVWDVVRSANLSVYGYDQPTTPGLESLARDAVVFERTISTSPWTLDSHGTLFTGLHPSQLSTGWFTALDDSEPTLAEALRAVGYRTGGFVGNHHYTSYDSGLDRGFDTYRDYPISLNQLLRSSAFTQTGSISGFLHRDTWAARWRSLLSLNFYVAEKRSSHRKHAEDINREFLEWLDESSDRPFFGFLNYFDAHLPYWSPEGTRERFSAEDPAVEGYDAAISYLDAQVTDLMTKLADRGILDHTIVVITSDHGELFGENDLYGHAHNLYLPVLHVPLLIRAPGVAGGVRVEGEVTSRDVAATVLDLAGVDSHTIPGTSLRYAWAPQDDEEMVDTSAPQINLPFLRAEVEQGRNTNPSQPNALGPMKSLIRDGLQYIVNGDGSEELYRYLEDPSVSTNLVEVLEFEDALAGFRRELDQWAPGLRDSGVDGTVGSGGL